jgi:hypothetical protein
MRQGAKPARMFSIVFHFPFIFQLRPTKNVKIAAIPAFLEFYCELPKVPLVNPNTLNWGHLTRTVPGNWKMMENESALACSIEFWPETKKPVPVDSTGTCTMSGLGHASRRFKALAHIEELLRRKIVCHSEIFTHPHVYCISAVLVS